MGLAGRKSLEIASAEKGAVSSTLRLVEIPVAKPGDPPRTGHAYEGFEELIYVLEGEGCAECESGSFPIRAGDTLLVPSGERHYNRNTGDKPLVLLCFFPVADVVPGYRPPRPAN